MKTSTAVQDAGWQETSLMCSRQDQKPRLKGMINGREAALPRDQREHIFLKMLLCLRNTLLKSILQLRKLRRRLSISAFVLQNLALPLHLYIFERKLCIALDFIHLVFYLKKGA